MAAKYVEFFNNATKEDQDDILTICETASRQIYDRFKTRIDDPKLLAAIISKTYDAFIKYLVSLEEKYSDFQINICDRLVIGYTTSNDEDDEKQGNFMIFIRHLNSNKKNDEIDDPTAKAVERAVQWNTENMINQPTMLNSIANNAVTEMSGIDIQLSASELVMPIFCTTYEAIVNYLKIKRREKDEFRYEINFMNCFHIAAQESEDENDVISIRPTIDSKLTLKNDAKASAQYE